jgi:hypothetical protein
MGMANTNGMNADDLLTQVNTAISKILLGGQSYQIGSRKLTRADLKELYAIRNDLQAQAAAGTPGLLDDCYVAVFDSR